jgi:hypothetical protein
LFTNKKPGSNLACSVVLSFSQHIFTNFAFQNKR